MLEIDVMLRLADFSLDVQIQALEGIIVLFGPSGSGKSVTLQCVAGLVRPDEGRIVVGGEVLFDSRLGVDLAPQRRHVGYVPQDYALFPHLTVAKNIAFGLDGWPRDTTTQKVNEMLDLMGLQELAERRPRDLSGGQQQRVALGRALVRQPRVLLLDEPFAALDTPVRAQLRQLVCDMQHLYKLPTLFVTHDLSEASFIGDQIAVIDRGKVHQVGTPNEILMRPADLVVARAVGVKNILAGRVIDRGPEQLIVKVGDVLLHTLPYAFDIGERVYLCIRQERVLFQLKDRPSELRTNQLLVQIVGETSDGLNCTVFLETLKSHDASEGALGDRVNLKVDLPVYVYERLDLARGQSWYVSIPPGAIHVMAPETE